MILVLAVVPALPTSASAQDYGRVEDAVANAPGYFYFTRPGDPVVTITAVGAVTGRGRYVVSLGTTAADLLALAGGVGTDRAGQATVRVYRAGGLALETDARDLYDAGADPVILRDGDVIEVVGLTSSVPGFYVHTEPGAQPLTVTAAGAFSSPGRYLVDPGTTVGDLVALAGGVGALGVREARTEVTSTVRVFRDGALVVESPLENLYARETLTLESGDVVDLQVRFERRDPIWRDVLSVTSAVLGVVILVERLAN